MKKLQYKISQLFLLILVYNLKLIYFFFKMFPVKNQIVLISRQSDNLSIDFLTLKKYIETKEPNISIKIICKRLEKNFFSKVVFYMYTIKQMYYLARSKVCVLDSYCLPVSVLNHKKELTVIQMWHAIGKIKKSGYQTVGKTYGRRSLHAKTLKMHYNYDFVIAGAPYWTEFYCKTFNVTKDKIVNFGLPRIDYILDGANNVVEKLKKSNIELFNKPIILYAPTFRKKESVNVEDVLSHIDYEKYNIIIKLHPNDLRKEKIDRNKYIVIDDYSASELLLVCDYLITDYSAIAFEAAIVDKKIFFLLYDYEKYISKNGLNFNLLTEVLDFVLFNSKDLGEKLEQEYNWELYKKFKEKVLPNPINGSTEKIANLIFKELEKK